MGGRGGYTKPSHEYLCVPVYLSSYTALLELHDVFSKSTSLISKHVLHLREEVMRLLHNTSKICRPCCLVVLGHCTDLSQLFIEVRIPH